MKPIVDEFEWDDEPLWAGTALSKATITRRAPAGGYSAPPREFKGGQFIPAADWNREKQLAKQSLPGILDTFDTRMQYLRAVWQATTDLGDNAPKSMPTPGQTRWMMKSIIRETYEQAFVSGKRAAGNLFAVTVDDKKAIRKVRLDEFKYLENFMANMRDGAGVMDYETRMDYYVKAARQLYWLGFSRANLDATRLISWKLGPTEHCDTCLDAAAGSPYPANVFFTKLANRGILPQSGALDCLGYHCQCSLDEQVAKVAPVITTPRKRTSR